MNKRLTRFGWLVLICTAFPIISSGQTNLTIETAIKVEFPTVNTNAYMLEQSTNLVDWAPVWFGGRWAAGYGHPIRQFFETGDDKLYFRVQTVPRPDVIDYTIPATNAIDVDPTITNLTVHFITDMDTNGISSSSSSWLIGESPFPYGPGTSGTWVDSQTYTRVMSLQTNTIYHTELVFRTTNGIPALPLTLSFTTRE